MENYSVSQVMTQSDINLRTCRRCKKEKERNFEQYYVSSRDGILLDCIPCQKARAKELRDIRKPPTRVISEIIKGEDGKIIKGEDGKETKICIMCDQEKDIS